jgi:probable HAF family extracellular repeat protein
MRYVPLFDWPARHASSAGRRTARARRGVATDPDWIEGRVLLASSIINLGPVAPPHGDITNVPTPDFIVAINSAAEVAATGYTNGGTETFFLNNNGQKTSLPPLPGDAYSAAAAVNAAGEVAGYSIKVVQVSGVSMSSDEAVLDNSQGQATDLGNLGGPSEATGLNDTGQVVGDSATGTSGSPTHAFLYNKSGPLIDLGTLGGSQGFATAINDAGWIVGYSTTGSNSDSPTHAFLLKGTGPMTAVDDLGVPPGYTDSYATAINAEGRVAAYATKGATSQSVGVSEPFLYSNGQWTDLGNLGGTDAVALAINDSGDVVGYSTTPPSPGSFGPTDDAFLYTSSGGIQDLNKLIDAGSKWALMSATATNANGVIAGLGSGPDAGYTDGFLLYPPHTSTPTSPGTTPGTTSPGTTPGTTSPGTTPGTTNPGTAPPPGSSPWGQAAGPLHTRTILSARPRSAKVGRPVTLTASVKVLGHGGTVPTGSVRFLDGSTVLGTVPLGAGRATLQTSRLPVGRNAIRVQYVGSGDFIASTSGVVVENVKTPRSRAKLIPAHTLPTSTPWGRESSVMVADRLPGQR